MADIDVKSVLKSFIFTTDAKGNIHVSDAITPPDIPEKITETLARLTEVLALLTKKLETPEHPEDTEALLAENAALRNKVADLSKIPSDTIVQEYMLLKNEIPELRRRLATPRVLTEEEKHATTYWFVPDWKSLDAVCRHIIRERVKSEAYYEGGDLDEALQILKQPEAPPTLDAQRAPKSYKFLARRSDQAYEYERINLSLMAVTQ